MPWLFSIWILLNYGGRCEDSRTLIKIVEFSFIILLRVNRSTILVIEVVSI